MLFKFISKHCVNCLIILPLFGIFCLIISPSSNKKLMQQISLIFSGISFLFSLILWILFNNSFGNFQFVNSFFWVPFLNLNFTTGIDGISIFFLLLTTLLIFLCFLTSWNFVHHYLKEYLICFMLLNFFLISVFCILDLLLFYIFFESVLIPMFLIIGIWGSREKKIRAAFLFFLYTLFGSVFMLLGILYLYYQVGTTDYETLLTVKLTNTEQKCLWLSFFASFSTKIPMIPVHIWLPEAHVEAPTSGSVILAGILLKLGVYGFIRFSIPLFFKACFFFAPLVYSIAAIGVIYTSFTAIRQMDFKRIIAYTSIAHMNLVIIGIFSLNTIGIEGAIVQSLSHGLISSALFLLIGVIYDRYSTRTIKYYSGLAIVMPLYTFFLLIFTMANISIPGTSNFIGEFLILAGSFRTNTTITILGATGMFLSGCYSLWLFNRISYGNIKTQYICFFTDMNTKEFLSLLPLLISSLLIGIHPNAILNSIHMSTNILIERTCYL